MVEELTAHLGVIKRDGMEDLIDFLVNKSDFTVCPASSSENGRGNCRGGLLRHSWNVFNRLMTMLANESSYSTSRPFLPNGDKEIAELSNNAVIVSLLHDVCMANTFRCETRKDENGNNYEWYTENDPLPYGHGEKSVYIIGAFIKLTREEAMALRWHEGIADPSATPQVLKKVYSAYPLALMLHLADEEAKYIDER